MGSRSKGKTKAENAIRVLVVEDHHLVRAGLVALLGMAGDIVVVADAEDGADAMEKFRLHRPDVVVVDLRLPRISGAEVIRTLRRESDQARFVVLTAHDGDEDVFRAIQAGARAYLLKGSTTRDLIEAIRSVHTGNSHFPSEISTVLARRLAADELTPREHEVLKKIMQGAPNRRIAKSLHVSEGTIKAHVNAILKKLGVSGRTQAVTAALQRGIVNLDSD